MIASETTLLDNPIWQALSTSHTRFAEGDDWAKGYPPAVTPLAAVRDQSPRAYDSLARLMPQGGMAGLFLWSFPLLPAGWTIVHDGSLTQMILNNPVRIEESSYEDLGSSNVGEMLALTELTNPGPFGKRTPEIGSYIGIRKGGQLVAMAGERLHLSGDTEISGACTHPTHRGRGYASLLVSTLVSRIIARNEIPFLHVASDNTGAASVYEKLGFRTRRILHLAVVKKDAE